MKQDVGLTVDHSSVYKKLKRIVGSENLTDKALIVEAYTISTAGKFSVGMQERPEAIKPGFIVRLASKEEIQEIMRLANQYEIPVTSPMLSSFSYSTTTWRKRQKVY